MAPSRAETRADNPSPTAIALVGLTTTTTPEELSTLKPSRPSLVSIATVSVALLALMLPCGVLIVNSVASAEPMLPVTDFIPPSMSSRTSASEEGAELWRKVLIRSVELLERACSDPSASLSTTVEDGPVSRTSPSRNSVASPSRILGWPSRCRYATPRISDTSPATVAAKTAADQHNKALTARPIRRARLRKTHPLTKVQYRESLPVFIRSSNLLRKLHLYSDSK